MSIRQRRRALAAAALVLAAVALAVVGFGSNGGDDRLLRASFTDVGQVKEGFQVRLAGREVGEVKEVALVENHAVITMRITDDRIWPLRRGTEARMRLGPAAAYAGHYIELQPGPRSAAPLGNNSILSVDATRSVVEFDDISRLFDRSTRSQIQGLLANAAAILPHREKELGTGLDATARAFDETTSFMRELGSDQDALRTLVASASDTAAALAARDEELREVVRTAAATFDEFAEHDRDAQDSIERLSPLLRSTRQTFARLDPSLVGLQDLVDDIRPGAQRLASVMPIVRRTVSRVEAVAPGLTATLRAGRRAAPDLSTALRAARPLLAELEHVFDKSAGQFHCIRPFTPEIAGFLSTWISFPKNYDDVSHYSRAHPTQTAHPHGDPRSPEEVVAQTPGVGYAFPRVPGLNAGQPWFIPECGYTRDTLDPSKDPEVRE